MRLLTYFILWVSLVYQSRQHELKGFDDTILFDINFPGKLADISDLDHAETMFVTSSMNEKYKCIVPPVEIMEEDEVAPYSGPSPLELIAPIFRQGPCSYRLESYWTYEVCHGKYIRQFHEDREGKKVKLQEYMLGKWSELQLEHLIGKTNRERLDLKPEFVAPTMKIDNMVLAYYEITMTNGTACDLNLNKPRSTIVKYVCFLNGKHEVYLLKELSTCIYEVVILTPLLCAHPKYKPRETGNPTINCVPTEGANDEPYSLTKLKRESAKIKKTAELDRLKVVELIQFKSEDAVTGDEKAPKFVTTKVSDPRPVQEFLQGTHCLYGGTGWWQFEFCYGKSIEQFHIERDGYRTSINLGMFDKEKHLEWIKEHPHKKPKPLAERKQLSHFYSGGSICDKTGQPRQTEVKLKCVENQKMSSVSLYLLEPKYCEYILGVESPLICEILDRADENGLVPVPVDFDDEDTVELNKITIKL